MLVELLPLEVNQRIYSTQQERAIAFKEHILDRRSIADNLSQPHLSAISQKVILMSLEIIIKDTRQAVLSGNNTIPGTDRITYNILKAT